MAEKERDKEREKKKTTIGKSKDKANRDEDDDKRSPDLSGISWQACVLTIQTKMQKS